MVAPEELAAGRSLWPAAALKRTLAARDTTGLLKRGGPTNREAPRPARFEVGDQVRAKNMHPVTHTRLPRYVRGHSGTITRSRSTFGLRLHRPVASSDGNMCTARSGKYTEVALS